MTGSPEIFLPRISGSDMFWSSNAWLPISSLSTTDSRLALGSSMPITLRPGMVATRADSADMLRAMSSASWITRLALMPAAGSSSYIVTTGPGRTSTMSPRTWKSSSTLSSRRALRSSPARSIGVLLPAGAAPSRASGGSAIIVAEREARLARPRPCPCARPCAARGGGDRLGRVGHRDRGARARRRGGAVVVERASRWRLRRGGLAAMASGSRRSVALAQSRSSGRRPSAR